MFIKIPDEDVSYASAKISITPTNQDPYTWFIAVSSQGTPEELADAYIDANGILMNTGLYDIYTGILIENVFRDTGVFWLSNVYWETSESGLPSLSIAAANRW